MSHRGSGFPVPAGPHVTVSRKQAVVALTMKCESQQQIAKVDVMADEKNIEKLK